MDVLPGRPPPKARWTGTCSQLPSIPGPQGSDTQPLADGLLPPAPVGWCVRMEGVPGHWLGVGWGWAGPEGLTLPR